jgi:hypothetical protein
MMKIFFVVVLFFIGNNFAPSLEGATDRQVQILPSVPPDEAGEDYRALHGAVSETLIPWLRSNPDIESGKALSITVHVVDVKKRRFRIELRPEGIRAVYPHEVTLEGASRPSAQKAVEEFKSVLLEVARAPAKKDSAQRKAGPAPQGARSGNFIYFLTTDSLSTDY